MACCSRACPYCRSPLPLGPTFAFPICKPQDVPLPPGTVLPKSEDRSGASEYQLAALVGSLNYLAQTTRPDIAYAVGALGRHTAAPGHAHWKAALHVLVYLYTTRGLGVVYHRRASYGPPFTVAGVCDSDYAGDTDTRRSTTGYAFHAAGGAISWSSKLQPTVAASTMEAEYMAAASAAKEGLWLKKLVQDLGYPHPTMLVGCDNQAALVLIHNPLTSLRAKHIAVHHHFVRERVEQGQLSYEYVPTAANASDVLTKALGPVLHQRCVSGLGLS